MTPIISIIIPAYNEEKRLQLTLLSLSQELLLYPHFEFEVFVVDDGSNDSTESVAKTFQSHIKNLTVMRGEKNRGKGFAVKQGMRAAHGNWRLFMDADNATPFSEFSKMIPYLEQNYDILIGSRNISGSKIVVSQPWNRKILGLMGVFFVKSIFLLNNSDIHCGFKCFRGEVANKIFSQTKINRWVFDDEVLILAKKMGYTIKEIPITWGDVKMHSTVKMSDYVASLFDILRIKYWLITKQYSL